MVMNLLQHAQPNPIVECDDDKKKEDKKATPLMQWRTQ